MAFGLKSALVKFVHETCLTNAFDQRGTECGVYRKRRIDDRSRHAVGFRWYGFSIRVRRVIHESLLGVFVPLC